VDVASAVEATQKGGRKMPQYFVVGAAVGSGRYDKYDSFVSNGDWFFDWPKGKSPTQEKRLGKIETGDRIAIKRRLGAADKDIQIRATGIVTGIDKADKRHVLVNWTAKGLNRMVRSKGCMATIHGPYLVDGKHGAWLKKVFART
jgi:hypothetical protein